MNILYTNFHSGFGGGHTTYILSLVNNTEHNVFVACPPRSRLYKMLQSIGYERLFALTFPSKLQKLPETIKNTLTLKKIISENSIDIVHTNGSADNRMALYASWLGGKKFKVVFTKHNTLKVSGIISKLRFNKFNDAIILVADTVASASGLPDNPRFHVVEHGIDTMFWQKKEEIKTGDKIRLVSNSGTTRNKGWIHLVEALELLPEDARNRFSVVLMGRQDPFLNSVWNDVQKVCDIKYAGFLDDTRPELEEGDVGFVLSYKEASSFATREMMSMALPVISSDFPASFNNITPETGWITPIGDARAISGVLLDILRMPPEQLNAMKLAARQRAESVFSVSKMISDTNKVYDGLMKGR